MRVHQPLHRHTLIVRLINVLLCLSLLSLTSCQPTIDAFKSEKCVAQTGSLSNGKGGGSSFPNKMSRRQCEKKCVPIRQAAIEEPTWGYCRFGNDYIWQENKDLQDGEMLGAIEETQARYEDAVGVDYGCSVSIYNSTDYEEVEREWLNVRSSSRCTQKCTPYLKAAKAHGASADCYLGERLLSHIEGQLGYTDEFY